jgi:hypothetical protein
LYQDFVEFVPQFKLWLALTIGIGDDEKRAHLTHLKSDHLIDQVWVQEILPPDKK